jgi:hypothetical protein
VTRTIWIITDAKASERHLACHIATGLSEMLERSSGWETPEQPGMFVNDSGQIIQSQTSNLALQTCDPGYEMKGVYDTFGIYGDSLPLYDEHYFPMGFFDVFSSTQFAPDRH